MATLADVIRKKRSGGQSRTGSFLGSLKDKLKEGIDPRQLINQTGILTALFPSLKAYKAKGVSNTIGEKLNKKSTELISSSAQSANIFETDLSAISINTEIAAKNTMVLPNLSRDVNVMRQNISKLVKVVGLKPETKADSFFKKSKERESEFEKQFEKKSQKSPSKLSDEDKLTDKDDSKSKGFLSLIGKLITSLVGSIVSAVKFVIGSLVSVIKGLLLTLITSLSSLIKNIFTTMVKTVFSIIKKLGSSLLNAVTFIRSAILPFLQRLMMSPAGAAIILAALVYMGLQNLAKDYIKGRKNKDRLKLLRELEKEGKLTPEQRTELNALNAAGETVTMGEGIRNAVTQTLDLQTVQGYLDDPTRTDDEIKKDLGVSREVLEAYREALLNRNLYARNGIPVPTLQQVAQSFGETVDRAGTSKPTESPTPTSDVGQITTPSREDSDIRTALEEDYKQSHLTAPITNTGSTPTTSSPQSEMTAPASSVVTNLTQNFNETRKTVQADNKVTVIPSVPASQPGNAPIAKSSVLPDVVNVDYPSFGSSQLVTV
jgi:hypothetical protein